MSVYKKINIFVFVLALCILLGVKWYWGYMCASSSTCPFDLTEGWLRPLTEGAQDLAIIFAAFLVFPGNVFKRWLQFVFSWAFPLSVLFIASIDIHNTGVFDFDRGNSARLLAILFAGVTAVFIAVYYLIAGWKKRKGVSISS